MSQLILAMLLVAGTCIGGGMLATPISTGISGFVPSLAVMTCCWAAMTATAILLLEVSLWFGEGVHVSTMTEKTLGWGGKVLGWVIFLFISYASLIAYTAAGGHLISEGIEDVLGWGLSHWAGCVLFFVLFGIFIDFGANLVGRVNSILFFGLIGAYVLMVLVGASAVSAENLAHERWSVSFLGIPLLLTSFSFQTMVPSLTPFLKRNLSQLCLAVIGGTTISFIVYIIWQWLVLGVVPPTGPNSLMTALEKGIPVTQIIKRSAAAPSIIYLSQFFAFFAIVTSFLGIGLGLFDFLSDGLKVPKVGKGKLLLGSLIAIPILFFAIYFEQIFLLAMDITGGFGDTILNGMMPVAMVWVGRYVLGYPPLMGWIGKKGVLAVIFLFFAVSFSVEVLGHLGIVSSIWDVKDSIGNI